MVSLSIKDYDLKSSSVITVGTFDGIHLGHQKLIKRVLDISKKENLNSIILSFHPHPKIVLNNNLEISLLNTLEEKKEILNSYDIDYFIIKEFTKEFSRLSPLEFVRDILVKKLNVKHIVIGYDHHFGRNREASTSQLKEFSKIFDFKVTEVKALVENNISVSSTKIRSFIKEGDFINANNFLGYNFILSGKVHKGLGRGKKLGFPTANITIGKNKIKPGNGVYFIYFQFNESAVYGMMNIGSNPTFKDKKSSIEIHFFDFTENLYDLNISVRIVSKIRNEIKFKNADHLSNQLEKDQKKCIELISLLKKTT
jgi:riboflavin kinase/FMN adenylyltransferase